MNAERTLTLIYFVLGIVMGILSNYLSTTITLIAGVGLYVISLFVTRQFIGEKRKLSLFVLNTLLTFVLIWIVTWIFISNL